MVACVKLETRGGSVVSWQLHARPRTLDVVCAQSCDSQGCADGRGGTFPLSLRWYVSQCRHDINLLCVPYVCLRVWCACCADTATDGSSSYSGARGDDG